MGRTQRLILLKNGSYLVISPINLHSTVAKKYFLFTLSISFHRTVVIKLDYSILRNITSKCIARRTLLTHCLYRKKEKDINKCLLVILWNRVLNISKIAYLVVVLVVFDRNLKKTGPIRTWCFWIQKYVDIVFSRHLNICR